MDNKAIMDMAQLSECHFYLTKERFFFYYQSMYGITDFNETKEDFKIFSEFPRFFNGIDPSKVDRVNLVLTRSIEIVQHLKKNWDVRLYGFSERKSDQKKFFYSEKEDPLNFLEIVIDFYKSEEIIALSSILMREAIVHNIAEKLTEIQYPKGSNKDIAVFEGDIYSTEDNYWRDHRSRVFIARSSNWRHLNYIKGKGYLNSKGRPNIDEDENAYSDFAITGCENFLYLGNITTHSHVLKD